MIIIYSLESPTFNSINSTRFAGAAVAGLASILYLALRANKLLSKKNKNRDPFSKVNSFIKILTPLVALAGTGVFVTQNVFQADKYSSDPNATADTLSSYQATAEINSDNLRKQQKNFREAQATVIDNTNQYVEQQKAVISAQVSSYSDSITEITSDIQDNLDNLMLGANPDQSTTEAVKKTNYYDYIQNSFQSGNDIKLTGSTVSDLTKYNGNGALLNLPLVAKQYLNNLIYGPNQISSPLLNNGENVLSFIDRIVKTNYTNPLKNYLYNDVNYPDNNLTDYANNHSKLQSDISSAFATLLGNDHQYDQVSTDLTTQSLSDRISSFGNLIIKSFTGNANDINSDISSYLSYAKKIGGAINISSVLNSSISSAYSSLTNAASTQKNLLLYLKNGELTNILGSVPQLLIPNSYSFRNFNKQSISNHLLAIEGTRSAVNGFVNLGSLILKLQTNSYLNIMSVFTSGEENSLLYMRDDNYKNNGVAFPTSPSSELYSISSTNSPSGDSYSIRAHLDGLITSYLYNVSNTSYFDKIQLNYGSSNSTNNQYKINVTSIKLNSHPYTYHLVSYIDTQSGIEHLVYISSPDGYIYIFPENTTTNGYNDILFLTTACDLSSYVSSSNSIQNLSSDVNCYYGFHRIPSVLGLQEWQVGVNSSSYIPYAITQVRSNSDGSLLSTQNTTGINSQISKNLQSILSLDSYYLLSDTNGAAVIAQDPFINNSSYYNNCLKTNSQVVSSMRFKLTLPGRSPLYLSHYWTYTSDVNTSYSCQGSDSKIADNNALIICEGSLSSSNIIHSVYNYSLVDNSVGAGRKMFYLRMF